MGNLSMSGLGWFGTGIESQKGVAAAIDRFLFLTTNGIEATPDVLRKSVFAATRQAERIVRTVKFKIGGPIGYSLYPNMGIELLVCVMGKDQYLTALAADTIASVAGPTNGLLTITLANGGSARTYTHGAWIFVGSAPAQQPVMILDIVSANGAANTVIKTIPLDSEIPTTTGTAIQQVGQHYFRPIPANDPLASILPTATVEINEAQKYAWLLAGCYVGKYNLKGGKEDVEVSANIMASVMPKRLDRPGSYLLPNPTVAPTAALVVSAGNVDAAAHIYSYTFYGPFGETTHSPASNSVVNDVTHGKNTVSGILAGPFGTRGRRLYRSNDGGTTWKRAVDIADNTTLTFTDNLADTSLGANPPVSNTTESVEPWTSFAPTDDELGDAQRPLTIVDGYCCLPIDNGDGTSSLQVAATLEDWEVDIDNGILEKAFWNRNRVYDNVPGNSKATLKYTYANEADRPTEFEDFLTQPYNVPIPFFAAMITNLATPDAPEWMCFGVHLPSCVITKAPTMRQINDVQTISVEADVVQGPSGEDWGHIFVVNSTTSAYAA